MAALKIENLITDHLALWTAAVRPKSSAGRGNNSKLELTGIKKLRELILELAVRGKLVPQDPSDEPASVLLERISAEKVRLVKEGKIKKPKALPQVSEQDKPFELPEGWVFTRLGELFNSISSGGTPSKREPKFWNGDIPWASVKDLGFCKFIESTQDYITKEGLTAGSKLADAGDILICTRMGLGKIAVVKNAVAFNQDLKAVKLSSCVSVDFFVNAYATVKLKGTGTTVEGIKQEQLQEYLIGLPPLAEQHRIVAKVDDLMALCDQLELRSESQLAAHQTLVEALLATLADSTDTDELAQNWARLSTHFDTLFTTEASIDALKQTILQLAVMGKLVPQDPSDEPAAALLERIAAEKARLVKEKAIRKPSSMSPIGELPQPFNMPSGWEWVRLGDICHTIADGPHFSPKYVDKNEGVAFLSARNISAESIDLVTAKYVSREDHESFCKRVRVKLGDVLYTKGGTTGIAKVNDIETEFSVWVHVAVLQIPLDKVCNNYLALALNSPHCYTQSQVYTHGIGNKDLGLTRMINITIPFPPLTEQYRIISKVDALMSLCDQLKASLKANQQTQLALAESLVEGALA